jgi:hypothetical protein
MIVPTKFERCSLCLKPEPLTLEHIIPESIGGTLEAKIQCVRCNSTLGSKLISQARQDPVFRLAIGNLKEQLPDLYLSMESGQRYVATDVAGKTVPVVLRDGRFETQAHKREDGSIILDTRKGEKNLSQMLAKEGLTTDEIESALLRYRDAPENQNVRLSPSRVAIRWGVKTLFPSLEKPEINSRLVVLVAYNFLCMLLGEIVFDTRLEFIRSYVLRGEETERIKIETFSSREYDCYHRLYPEFGSNETRINMVFFGWLIYVVHLTNIVCNVPYFAYAEDLKNKCGMVFKSVEDAKNGIFYSTKDVNGSVA